MLSEEEFHAELISRLESLRREKGLTVTEMCRLMGLTRRNWWMWRSGGTPRAYALYRLSIALERTYEDLMPRGGAPII